ncbi:GH92 family glycosyl hydrolase [Pedobacter sp. MC2016-14]|uniref:GH92 family glycosyl hydrolase n=1 Tax=Pedobacter sp. MC2016-14 TaxID=2897327 RepID=UPI001E524037|nr:GH92 family glycosyl hydrolase [Pedobacter sp. MC2016-14]MCD0488705.1 GH92 family glycosyl hydrolase [Pedobacter sp. MC2016-14]
MIKEKVLIMLVIFFPVYGKLCAQLTHQNKKAMLKDGLTQYVNPYIGTGFHGHVFLGANVPFGAVQLGPVNLSTGWDWCSGYHYSDSTITGFSHTHLSGTGIGDLGDISVMPVLGDVQLRKGNLSNEKSGYYSLFTHQDEVTKPGYYSVKLKRYGIKAELTASKRVGFHQYTFPAGKSSKIIIDLQPGIGWDQATETCLYQENENTVSGYRYSMGWAKDQRIYFTAVFSKPIRDFSLYDSISVKEGKQLKGLFVKGVATFDTRAGEKISLKVAISPVSVENAKLNMKAEMPGWDFSKQVERANEAWNNELGRIAIKTIDAQRKRVFYTALYHTMIAPSVFNDVNGDYLGTDKKVYKNAAFTNYTTFSLWDTYRAAHPLMTLINPEKTSDLINTMLAIYQQQGKLPVWHLMANETDCMVGNPALPVIADAYLKGIKGFDKDLAYQAMKITGMRDERGLYYIKKYGYLPADSLVENVAIGLEFAIADWSVAQVAKKRGANADYIYWSNRGQNYRNYFDKNTRFMRGRVADKSWRTPFNPISAIHQKDDFTEGNAWQYTWLVPHDVEGLIGLMGGEQQFETKLDSLFTVKDELGVIKSNDISGLIGQYAHGNEPSHHIAYLYGYLGKPAKAADKVRFIMDNLYTDKADGLSGNEDVGQMSAWYIFSALGFYPVNPANGLYVFGSPVVDDAILDVGAGKTFHISVKNNTKTNKYIQSIQLNGKPYTKAYIQHSDFVKGGEMIILMGSKPAATWGTLQKDRAYSVAN